MTKLEWKAEYSVGVKLFDDHHKQLLQIIGELENAIETKCTPNKCQMIFSKLVEYSQYHFDSEETLLAQNNYTELHQQKGSHQKFISTIKSFRHRVQLGDDNVELELFEYLNNWMIHHILTEDKRYTAFFAKRNIG